MKSWGGSSHHGCAGKATWRVRSPRISIRRHLVNRHSQIGILKSSQRRDDESFNEPALVSLTPSGHVKKEVPEILQLEEGVVAQACHDPTLGDQDATFDFGWSVISSPEFGPVGRKNPIRS